MDQWGGLPDILIYIQKRVIYSFTLNTGDAAILQKQLRCEELLMGYEDLPETGQAFEKLESKRGWLFGCWEFPENREVFAELVLCLPSILGMLGQY